MMTEMKAWRVGILALTVVVCGGCGASENTSKVVVSNAQFELMGSWPKDIVFFTRASKPITSLDGLKDGEFAAWGMELVPVVQKLLVLSGREDTPVGFAIIGTGNDEAKFNKNPKLKLFVTHESLARDILEGGGVRIKFVLK